MILKINRKPRRKRIVILGGGFGGVYAAIHLENQLRQRKFEAEIYLVSRDNFFLFTPMLHEVAASDLEMTNIVNPLRKLLRKVTVIVGETTEIDLPNKRILVARGDGDHTQLLTYDHLVIALGSVTHYHDLPGFSELALAMKSLPDAVRLRAQVLRRLEDANSEPATIARQSLLTFVVAGGGFAGVETVAALNDFLREALPFYPNLSEEMLRVMLVHSRPAILPELGRSLGEYAHQVLAQRAVEIRLNTRVKRMTKNGVVLLGGALILARTVVWTGGTAPNPLIADLPCAKEKGRICVNEFLQVVNWPGVWAVGDCACVPDLQKPGQSHPPTAQHAIREGRIVAKNIAAELLGRGLTPFSFRTIGLLASIGRRTGVAQVFGFNFSGFIAWWMWRTIYLSKLPGFDKKVRVAFDWTLDLLFPKDVCAVYDLDPRRHLPRPVPDAIGNNGSHDLSPRRLSQPSTEMVAR